LDRKKFDKYPTKRMIEMPAARTLSASDESAVDNDMEIENAINI